MRSTRFCLLFCLVVFLASCSPATPELFDIRTAQLLLDETGAPISTRITDDESLGTVHTFDLFPIVASVPVKSPSDGLWRLSIWVPKGNTVSNEGHLTTLVLGYDDTVIVFDLLPGHLFDWKTGTATIAEVAPQLSIGQQIFIHVIAEHSFTEEDIQAITAQGFDYPILALGHETQNLAILEALQKGATPPPGEITGLGALYLGVN